MVFIVDYDKEENNVHIATDGASGAMMLTKIM